MSSSSAVPPDSDPVAPPFPAEDHDHDACRATALARAERLCGERGARLTDLRRRVLDILWEDHRPLGAYDVLARLNAGPDGAAGRRPAAPPTVYRALEFLVAQGLVHRLASLNAYVGCTRPGRIHGAQFFICRVCHAVAELRDADLGPELARLGAAIGFWVDAPVLEIPGLCPQCRQTAGADATP